PPAPAAGRGAPRGPVRGAAAVVCATAAAGARCIALTVALGARARCRGAATAIVGAVRAPVSPLCSITAAAVLVDPRSLGSLAGPARRPPLPATVRTAVPRA